MRISDESEVRELKLKEGFHSKISIETIKGMAFRLENSKAAVKLEAIIGKIPILKKLNNLSIKKKRAVFTAILLVIVVGAYSVVSGLFMGESQALEYTEYEVSKGNVTVSISGSGTVEPIRQYDVVALVEGEVLEDTFNEGDTVEKGQLLYKIDSSDMEKTLEKANISYEKSQMSYQSSQDAYNGLTVTAPIAGRVTEIYVEKGDNVSSGSKIAAVVDDTYLTAKVPFNVNDIGNLYNGQSVTVTVENTFEQLSGTITKIYNSKRILDGYISVTDVVVTIKNPGALSGGTYVTVNAGGVDCHEGAALECTNEKIVTAGASGMVTKLTATEGEYLSRGGEILKLSSDSAGDSLKSSELSMREAELSYQSTQEQLDNYSITAPISGSVISKTVKAGDTLESSSSAQTILAVIADMSTMTFTIDVDELDIASMKKGQEVNITADALSNRKFTGYVDNIGLLGTSTNGVTSYPVTIVINDGEDLWPGMNVTADIVIDSAEDVLTIPVAAVNRGNTVLVKGAEGTEGVNQSSAPSGAQYVRVELGLNDDSYIEIAAGLKEGDVVLVPAAKTEGETTTQMQKNGMMPGTGMPAGGGGMPQGGGQMPSGGRPDNSGGGAPGM